MSSIELESNAITTLCAIDIGSGMTKFVIAIVDKSQNQIVEELQFGEFPIPFALNWKENGKLSKDIIAKGLKYIKDDILKSCKALGIDVETDVRAIGTEVFRKAPNGMEYLDLIRKETGINVDLISQEREAKLGYLTGLAIYFAEKKAVAKGACALRNKDEAKADKKGKTKNDCAPFDVWIEARNAANTNVGSVHVKLPLSNLTVDVSQDSVVSGIVPSDLIVYDSGGGSFQIVQYDCSSSEVAPTKLLNHFLSDYAVAGAMENLYIDIKKVKRTPKMFTEATPNPCTRTEVMEFLALVKDRCFPNTNYVRNSGLPFLQNRHVFSISGINGIFRLAVDMIYHAKRKEQESHVIEYSFIVEELKNAIFSELIDKSDDVLGPMFCNFPGSESPNYLLPKACLLLTVMETLEICRIHWRPSTGNCFGMLLDL